ncbi:hypothetical protein BKA67DRAFT_536861 [Truncatella angustata]|uniref:Zn(2)-C6 fungal-type domain-containing protein n=1 Tax=Truncatella angustata TaxID=152316 RepID=A0A9P8UJ97_9PEZI|nr:uncharacterized protein BKA67DRAFT_536861 [Truncatella angustata]KAH6653167.1 hypothetical protein BKA67DRAFT_536861 [Truncatella angustata]
MVFPSQACLTCKNRRIKCDAARPACSRCSKADRRCVWSNATRAGGLVFKCENAHAEGEARRPRKAPSVAPRGLPAVQIPGALRESIDTHALNFWVRNWTDRPSDIPDIGHEYLTYIPSHWETCHTGSSLRLAVSAQSLMVFGRLHNVRQAMAEAGKYYAQAIRKTQSDIQTLAHADIDELTTTYNHRIKSTNSHSDVADDGAGSRYWKHVCHYLGTAGILKTMKTAGGQYSLNLPLYRAVRRPIVRAAILRGMPVQHWLQDAAAFGEEGPALQLDSLMIRIAELRVTASSLLHSVPHSTPSVETLVALLARSLELDSDLSAWPHKIAKDFEYSVLPLPQKGKGMPPFCGNIAHNYRSYSHASVWNRYRAVRMISNSLVLQVIDAISSLMIVAPATIVQSRASLNTIRRLASDICQSLPYYFNFGYPTSDNMIPKVLTPLSWPLAVAISIKGVPDNEMYWFKYTLQAVAGALSDSVLENIAQGQVFKF